MKGRTIYIIGVACFLGLIVMLTLQLPRKFVWEETYGARDTQPYGCYVFDSLMRQTMPQGYTVSGEPLTKLAREKGTPRNLLIAADGLSYDSLSYVALRQMAERGSRIVLAFRNTQDEKLDSLLFQDCGIYVNTNRYVWNKAVRGNVDYDAVYWREDDRYRGATFREPSVLLDGYLVVDTIARLHDLATIINNSHADREILECLRRGESLYTFYEGSSIEEDSVYSHPVAATCRIGRGEITVVSMPLLFTNYGILTEPTRTLTMRLMDRLTGAPVVRCTYFCPVADNLVNLGTTSVPTDFFLQHRALRLALQLTGLLIVLLMVFRARRRQRAIPVYRQPENHTLEFAQLIGSLYYHRRDNLDLVRKKYRLFAETLRRRLDIDVMTAKDQPDNVSVLAQRTGLAAAHLTKVLNDTRDAYFGNQQLADNRMKQLIEQMNEITERL